MTYAQSALSVSDYFETALPKILRLKNSHAVELNVNVRFVVTGRGGGTWTLRLRPPAARVVPGAEWKADLAVRITAAELQNILAGCFDARRAIAQGNVEFTGDTHILRRVGFIFQLPGQVPSPVPAVQETAAMSSGNISDLAPASHKSQYQTY